MYVMYVYVNLYIYIYILSKSESQQHGGAARHFAKSETKLKGSLHGSTAKMRQHVMVQPAGDWMLKFVTGLSFFGPSRFALLLPSVSVAIGFCSHWSN